MLEKWWDLKSPIFKVIRLNNSVEIFKSIQQLLNCFSEEAFNLYKFFFQGVDIIYLNKGISKRIQYTVIGIAFIFSIGLLYLYWEYLSSFYNNTTNLMIFLIFYLSQYFVPELSSCVTAFQAKSIDDNNSRRISQCLRKRQVWLYHRRALYQPSL